MNMPVMNGPKCLQGLIKIDRLRQVPVIIYTTSKVLEEHRQSMEAGGVVHFMIKPSSMKGMRTAVANVLAHRWNLADQGIE